MTHRRLGTTSLPPAHPPWCGRSLQPRLLAHFQASFGSFAPWKARVRGSLGPLTRCSSTRRASRAHSGCCRISVRAWPMSEEGLFSLTSFPMSMNPVESTEGHLRACPRPSRQLGNPSSHPLPAPAGLYSSPMPPSYPPGERGLSRNSCSRGWIVSCLNRWRAVWHLSVPSLLRINTV